MNQLVKVLSAFFAVFSEGLHYLLVLNRKNSSTHSGKHFAKKRISSNGAFAQMPVIDNCIAITSLLIKFQSCLLPQACSYLYRLNIKRFTTGISISKRFLLKHVGAWRIGARINRLSKGGLKQGYLRRQLK